MSSAATGKWRSGFACNFCAESGHECWFIDRSGGPHKNPNLLFAICAVCLGKALAAWEELERKLGEHLWIRKLNLRHLAVIGSEMEMVCMECGVRSLFVVEGKEETLLASLNGFVDAHPAGHARTA
jgi:hypothetical protein